MKFKPAEVLPAAQKLSDAIEGVRQTIDRIEDEDARAATGELVTASLEFFEPLMTLMADATEQELHRIIESN